MTIRVIFSGESGNATRPAQAPLARSVPEAGETTHQLVRATSPGATVAHRPRLVSHAGRRRPAGACGSVISGRRGRYARRASPPPRPTGKRQTVPWRDSVT